MIHTYPGHPGDGAYPTTKESAAILQEAHVVLAELLNAAAPDEIVLGASMTALNFLLARTLGKHLKPGGEIIVSRMGHEAHISPWLLMAEEHGHRVKWIDVHPEDCTLDLESFERALSDQTRLVAVDWASNAVGTINPIPRIAAKAHETRALVAVDGVQYIPHAPTDVQASGADFVTCSIYKFFGPHMGAMWGRWEILDLLPAWKVRPAPNRTPDKFEIGTQNYEGAATIVGAMEYLAWVGQTFGAEFQNRYSGFEGRKRDLHCAMAAVREYEGELGAHLIASLSELPGVKVWGITDPARINERVPTVSFTLKGHSPRTVGRIFAENNIVVWIGAGDYYAVELMKRLGLAESGGLVRVGAVHYNTIEEIDTMVGVVRKIASSTAAQA